MKNTIRLSALIGLIVFLFSCSSSRKIADPGTVILPYSDTVTVRNGTIVYGLPRTVFTVSVTMERTIDKPGPYAKYAADLLGIDNAIQNENESWSIVSVSVKSHQELDPSEFYVIRSNSVFLTNVLSLKNEGMILDLNPAIFNNTGNQIVETGLEQVEFSSFDLGSDEYYQVQRDTAYKRVAVDSTFIRIPYAVEKKKRLTTDQLAERAAKRLMDLRDGKVLILTGEATVFPQNDAAINEINRMEKEYTELFTGKSLKEIRTFSYQLIPDTKMSGKPVTLFLFSDLTGPVDALAKGGLAVTVELTPELKTKKLSLIDQKPVVQEQVKSDKLFYRVPDVVNMKISYDKEVLYNSRKLIYQFGELVNLPSNFIIGR